VLIALPELRVPIRRSKGRHGGCHSEQVFDEADFFYIKSCAE
jgi:hypothetical protein